MFLASIFETLNLKFGKPTHKAMRNMLKRLPLIGKMQLSLTRQIVEYLLKRDEELCQKYGGTMAFVVLKKTESLGAAGSNEPDLACPICKTPLAFKDDKYLCNNCHKQYLHSQGIPFLLSYSDEMPLQAYIDNMKGKTLPDFYC
jgi:hypothetical protein